MSERILSVGGNKASRPITDFVLTNPGLQALVAAGLGGAGAWIKTDSGVKTIHAGTAGTKKVLIVCTVTQAFANGTGAQPTYKIGQVGTDDKFAAAAVFTDAILNKVFVLSGELTASTNLIVTITAAVGNATGAMSVAAFILPATV